MPDISRSLIDWPTESPPYDSLEAAVQGETARWNAVGLAAGTVRNGERKIAVSGFANAKAGYPLVNDSLFMIGSISKIYTATLAMRLMEQGVLDLDTPVINYVPEFRLAHEGLADAVTIRMLLSHTSGFDGDRFTSYGRGDDSYEKAIAEFTSLEQWFQPGSFYSYNNAGFYLTGYIIQRLTGKTYETNLMEEIFAPLGLENSFIYPEDALNKSWAVGHVVDRVSGVSFTPASHLPRHANPAGGVLQSVGDLLTFAQMHLNHGEINAKRIISAENARLMQEPVIEADTYNRHYGIGWSIYDRPTGMSVGHGGAWGGHRANLILFPQHNYAHASLGNSNVSLYAEASLEKWALQHDLHITNPEPERVDLSKDELQSHAGTYLRHDSRWLVTAQDSGLRLTVTDIDEDTGEASETERIFDLEPLEADRFRVSSPESKGATVDFRAVPDATGTNRNLMRIWGRVGAREQAG